jgi:RNA polymerase sigma-70 factor (ECF subfamily)
LSYDAVPGHTTELQELIDGCIRNERSAQERIYKLFYPRMMATVCRYIDHKEQAEEILNDAFLRAFQRISQYALQGAFEGWLRKIVLHTVINYAQAQIQYKKTILLVEKDEYVHKDHAAKLYYNELLALVQALSPPIRTVFNLYVMEGFKHREIAKMLGISEGTSKWYLAQGRIILKNKIEQLNLH